MLNDVLNRLRSLNCDRSDTDELVGMLAFADVLKGTYASSGLLVPEWVNESASVLKREIADRRRDELLREKKLLEAKERKLMSRDEQRDEVKRRKDEIDKLLGVATAPVAAGE